MPRHPVPGGPATPDQRSREHTQSGKARRGDLAPRRAGLLAATLAAVLASTGCSAAAPSTPGPTSPLPAEVTVQLHQLRSDVGPRQAQVRVANASDAPITVGAVRVDDPRFAGPAGRVIGGRQSTIPAGGSADIRVQLPAVECSVPDDGVAEAVLEIIGDGVSVEATASAPDPLGFVAALHARECLLEQVTDAAALAFTGFEPSPPGEPAALALTVTPTGVAEAAIVGIERTNLLTFEGLPPGADLFPLELEVLAEARPPSTVALPLVPTRCDPHAVQEDKRGTIFDVRVEVDGQPGEVELFVGEDTRGWILSWVAAWCGFGG